MFREYLTCFSNVKCFTFLTWELVNKVGRFAVGKGGDGISKVSVGASERLGGDVDGTSLAGEESTCGGGGRRAEDLAILHWRNRSDAL